jgi:hypothetical protein
MSKKNGATILRQPAEIKYAEELDYLEQERSVVLRN